MLGVAAQILEPGARAVRSADDVEALVAEGGAHVVQVVDGGCGGVHPQIGGLLELGTARPYALEGEERAQRGLRILARVEITVDGVRAARPTLVDEEDVAMLPQRRVVVGDERGLAGDRFAGSAAEEGERVGLTR